MNKLTKTLTQIATVLTLFLVFYFFYTYNYKDDRKLQSSGDGVYENTR
jgi:hypothetical protein